MVRIGNRTFDDVQLNNARVIASTGKAMGVSDRDIIIAFATAIIESNIRRLASRANPGSLNYPHDGVAKGDHDSVGIFQQRDPWGSLQVRMDAAGSARLFFGKLLRIRNRNSMSVGQAAQAVQVSAYPDRYATVESIARELARYININVATSAIYAIQPDGTLQWWRHDGRADGSFSWTGPNPVGNGWQDAKSVFAGGDGVLYAIQPDGSLQWWRHDGRADGTFAWTGPNPVGTGWQDYKTVFSGGGAILYAIQQDGTLLWFRHDGQADGSSAWTGPNPVGTGWQDYKSVFSGGGGMLYAIQPDGTLLWYRHDGWADGSSAWTGPNPVGTGWQDAKSVFAGGDGIIYAIQPDGTLLWYRHDGRADGSSAWTGPNPVGTGWQDAKSVFAGGSTPPPEPPPSYPAWPGEYLRLGSKGPHVQTVQARLQQRGWQISVDGDFGPETDRVVRAFQTEKQLVSDGVVGPDTWKALWIAPIT